MRDKFAVPEVDFPRSIKRHAPCGGETPFASASSENQPSLRLSMLSVMLPMPETSCRVFSRSNLRSFLASLRVALTARLFSFRSGVRFAIWKEYQHFRVPADCARPARVVCQPNCP
jgi:hypothetical protein